MKETTIRNVELTDAAALARFLSVLARETPFTLVSPEEQDAAATHQSAYLGQLRNAPNQALIVAATADGQIVGCISLAHGTLVRMRHVCSVSMGVLKEFWGSGLADGLMAQGLKWGKARSVKRFELSVDVRNARAIRFYEKHGFACEGTRRQSLCVDGQWVDEAYYSRVEL